MLHNTEWFENIEHEENIENPPGPNDNVVGGKYVTSSKVISRVHCLKLF